MITFEVDSERLIDFDPQIPWSEQTPVELPLFGKGNTVFSLNSADWSPDGCWLYVAQDSMRYADRLIAEIQRKCELLSSSPGRGRRRDELRRSLRSFPWEEYVVFHRLAREGIEVVRILHGHRDIEEIFLPE